MCFEGRAGYSVYKVRCNMKRQDSCLKDRERDSPGRPVVKTLPFQCGGVGTILGWRTKSLHAMQPETKKEREKRQEEVSQEY